MNDIYALICIILSTMQQGALWTYFTLSLNKYGCHTKHIAHTGNMTYGHLDQTFLHIYTKTQQCNIYFTWYSQMLGWPKSVGMLSWFKWLGMLGWLELACPTVWACLFKVRPGVLSKTLFHILGKLNLLIFLFKVGLFTLINIDSLIFLSHAPPSLLFGSFAGWWDELCYCYDDVWGKDPSGALWIFLQRSQGFPYVFIIAGKVPTLEPVYCPIFVDHGVFVLGGNQ